MTQSRGQNQASDAVETKAASFDNNEEEHKENENQISSESNSKIDEEQKKDTEATADENRNLLANTVKSYINEIEQLKAEKSQLMGSFLNAQRQIESTKDNNY